MNTDNAHNKKMEATDRDSIIGSTLSKALAIAAPVNPCPTAERIAVIIDGNVSENERDSLLAHMAACDHCREVYLLANDMLLEEPVQFSFRRWYMAGGALAVAALVVLAVKLTIQEPSAPLQHEAHVPVEHQQVAPAPKIAPEVLAKTIQEKKIQNTTFSPTMAARQLINAASTDELAAFIGAPASGSFGFAKRGDTKSTVFQAGKELFELELWLAAEDKERAGLATERLLPLLRSVEHNSTTAAPLDGLLLKLEAGPPDDISPQLEALLKAPHRGIFRLGCWVAAARVAIDTGTNPYFNGNPPQHFLKELGTDISPEARDLLGILGKNKIGTNPAKMRRLLDKLENAI